MVVDVLTNMKESVIKDFYSIIKSFKKADYAVNYQNTLNKILFLDTIIGLDNIDPIYSKLYD